MHVCTCPDVPRSSVSSVLMLPFLRGQIMMLELWISISLLRNACSHHSSEANNRKSNRSSRHPSSGTRERWLHGLEHLLLLQGTRVQLLASTWWVITTYTFSSRASRVLFWPPQAPDIHVVYRHTWRPIRWYMINFKGTNLWIKTFFEG